MPRIQYSSNRYFVVIPLDIIQQTKWDKGTEVFFNYIPISKNDVVVLNSKSDKIDKKDIIEEVIRIFGMDE